MLSIAFLRGATRRGCGDKSFQRTNFACLLKVHVCLIGMDDALSAKGTLKSGAASGSGGPRIRLVEPFSVDEPRYLLGQVAFAAGISANLLKTWIARTIIVLGEHDRDAHGKGSSRVFTFRRALVIAATAELIKMGVPTTHASRLGRRADWALDEAGGDPLRVEGIMTLYPIDDGYGVPGGAHPTWTIAKVLKRENSGLDEAYEAPVSFLLLSLKPLTERVLRRLGELA